MSYLTEINQLEIKKTILVNTLELFIPDSEYNGFIAKLKKLNNQLYKFRSLQFISNLTNKEIQSTYISIRNNVNKLADLSDSLNIKDIEVLRYELYKQYRDYLEQRA